jgi:rhodanese-related sulfurtransferase
VRLIDVREGNEINGPLGHVPGADWVPFDDVGAIADRLHRDAPVVLIARGDERAMKGAKLLEEKGMRMAAAMMGGMVAWKALGFATTREQKILTRRASCARSPPTSKSPPATSRPTTSRATSATPSACAT